MSVTVAFRTHIWNNDIKKIALRIKNTFSNAHFVIIADETNSILDTGNIPKITHTKDFSAFNLPSQHGLWYNGDYPLYTLRQSFPEDSHILMIENDVQINFDLDILINSIVENNIDLVVHNLAKAQPSWMHYSSLEYFEEPQKCLFPLIALSSRAIDHLLETRVAIAKTNKKWPYCEGFIASAISEMPGNRIIGLNNFCKPHNYSFANCHHYDDPRVNVPGTISHPIRGNSFPEKALFEQNISTIFFRNSILRVGLKYLDPKDFYKQVYSKIINTGNIDIVNQFNDLALQEGWIMKPEAINWALGAKAEQSSVSRYSHHQDVFKDASGAVSGKIDHTHSFHTTLEPNPWWKVELPEAISIRHIIIYNRMHYQERASKIKIEISENDKKWITVAEYPDGILFGGADGNPLVVKVNAVLGKFVRISLLDTNLLHLNQVEVYNQ